MVEYTYDQEADAIYITLGSEPYAYGRDLDDQRRIDYSSYHQEIGIELLSVSGGVDLYGLPFANRVAGILNSYNINTYRLIHSDHIISATGTVSFSFGILLGSGTDERQDKYERGIKKELTGVS
jgi:uncharacterized protein YuzE